MHIACIMIYSKYKKYKLDFPHYHQNVKVVFYLFSFFPSNTSQVENKMTLYKKLNFSVELFKVFFTFMILLTFFLYFYQKLCFIYTLVHLLYLRNLIKKSGQLLRAINNPIKNNTGKKKLKKPSLATTIKSCEIHVLPSRLSIY